MLSYQRTQVPFNEIIAKTNTKLYRDGSSFEKQKSATTIGLPWPPAVGRYTSLGEKSIYTSRTGLCAVEFIFVHICFFKSIMILLQLFQCLLG